MNFMIGILMANINWRQASIFNKFFLLNNKSFFAGAIPKSANQIAAYCVDALEHGKNIVKNALKKDETYCFIIDETTDEFSSKSVINVLYSNDAKEKPILLATNYL